MRCLGIVSFAMVTSLWACRPSTAASPAALSQEQPAIVVHPGGDKQPGSKRADRPSHLGEVKACTQLIGTIREMVSEVSEAYAEYDRSKDLAAFSRKVREWAGKASSLTLEDPKLRSIAERYQGVLVQELEALTATSAGTSSPALGEAKGRVAIAQEGELIDELMAYCGMGDEKELLRE